MDDEVDDQIDAVERRRHRIDEEGHVVVDDLDDRASRAPAVLVRTRAEDSKLGLARLPFLRELPQRYRGAVEVLGIARQNIVRRNMGIELTYDLGKRRRFLGALPVGNQACNILD